MVIRFRRSAFRHGISDARIRHVVENCPVPMYLEPTTVRPDRLLFLWHDLNGVPIEVVGVETTNGDVSVVHAMRMREIYRADYLRMLT